MKIIAFAGSNSTDSINKKLATWVSSLFAEHQIEILDLNDYEVPIYKKSREQELGIPDKIITFSEKLSDADLILLSLAENNGAYSTAFKNILDWASRIPDTTVFHDKPILLMATSPGQRGGSSVLEIAKNRFQFNGGNVLDTYSLPSFNDNFEEGKGITNEELLKEINDKVTAILDKLK